MTDSPTVSTVTSGSGFPRVTLGVVWVLAALVVGVLGWPLNRGSDWPDDRVAGGVLLGAFLLAGAAVAVMLSAFGPSFASDLLLFGGLPVACGVVTGLLALRRVAAVPRR